MHRLIASALHVAVEFSEEGQANRRLAPTTVKEQTLCLKLAEHSPADTHTHRHTHDTSIKIVSSTLDSA